MLKDDKPTLIALIELRDRYQHSCITSQDIALKTGEDQSTIDFRIGRMAAEGIVNVINKCLFVTGKGRVESYR